MRNHRIDRLPTTSEGPWKLSVRGLARPAIGNNTGNRSHLALGMGSRVKSRPRRQILAQQREGSPPGPAIPGIPHGLGRVPAFAPEFHHARSREDHDPSPGDGSLPDWSGRDTSISPRDATAGARGLFQLEGLELPHFATDRRSPESR